jgi:ferritin
MMNETLARFLDESIRLELNMSDFYRLLSVVYPQDAAFWSTLSSEEVHHAALIKSVNDNFLSERIVPFGTVGQYSELLSQSNRFIEQKIQSIRTNPPPREDIFRLMVELETSAGEIHYQRMMGGKSASVVEELFQKLNGEDNFHARRIMAYARENCSVNWELSANADE